MKVQDFINKLVHISTNCKTKYKTGGWGQHEGNVWLFDCICLIKGILWGWREDYNDKNGGAVYGSNGVYDDTEIGILNRCSNVSSDFSNIEIGEYLYMNGHGGIYIGDRKVVECTVAWDRKVQISDIGTDGTRSKNGKVVGRWLKHGKLPYVEYINVEPVAQDKEQLKWQIAMNEQFGLSLEEDNHFGPDCTDKCSKHNIIFGMQGAMVEWLQTKLLEFGFSVGPCGVDGKFGNDTKAGVIAFQRAFGLKDDGEVGINTTRKLLK